MEKKDYTFTASITYPAADVEAFADQLGYQTQVENPDYIPSDFNPDTMEEVTPAVGSPTISNPETREDYVKRLFKDMVVSWFTQFAERNISQAKAAEARETVETLKEQIRASITI